jgi:hypothetical protein
VAAGAAAGAVCAWAEAIATKLDAIVSAVVPSKCLVLILTPLE